MKKVVLFLMSMFVCSVVMAAVPKAEVFKLGSSEKKVELVQLQGSAGCEVLYQGQKVGWGQANPGKCESIYNQISSNLTHGGYVVADAGSSAAAPAVVDAEAAKKDLDKKDAAKAAKKSKGKDPKPAATPVAPVAPDKGAAPKTGA